MAGPPELPPIGIPEPPPASEPTQPEVEPEAQPQPQSDPLTVPETGPAPTPVPGPPAGSGPPPPPPPPPDATRHPADTYGDPAKANVADPFATDPEPRRPRITPPIPTWKMVGLGVSAGVTATSLAVAIGLAIPLRRSENGRGELSDEIRAEAEASLDTVAPVDPDQGTRQICDQALSEPNPNQPGRVYNASVGEPCLRGSKLALGANVAWGIAGIGLVSTAVFAGLLFLRPAGSSKRAHRQHRRVYFAAGPSAHRGWNIATRVSF